MTTERDIRLFLKPLVDADPQLHYFKRTLFIKPIDHTLRMIGFDAKMDPLAIMTNVILRPLCTISNFDEMGLPFTEYFWPSGRLWSTDDQGFPDRHRAIVADDLVPALKQIATLQDFRVVHNRYYENTEGPYTRNNTFMACMLGEWDVAAEMLRREQVHPDFWTARMINEHVPGLGDRLCEKGDALSKRDKRALIAMMHEREAIAAKALKLEKHWQPSPFPAEEAGLV